MGQNVSRLQSSRFEYLGQQHRMLMEGRNGKEIAAYGCGFVVSDEFGGGECEEIPNELQSGIQWPEKGLNLFGDRDLIESQFSVIHVLL
ncbi:hypothetical protein OROMI_017157 [Orobanche minor]